jgi:NADH-quinone oxidoreductase subunit G
MSPFKHGTAYADVLLPVAPFTETPGTFINCEGRVQSFHAVVYPRGETRPAWKVLRVLGTLMRFPGFDIDTSEIVRDSALSDAGPLDQRLSNAVEVEITAPATAPAPLERVADVPIYFADPLVRRAMSLQQTADARPPKARMHRSLLDKLGVAEGEQVKLKQGRGEAVLAASVDAAVPPGVIRVAAAHASTCGLEGLSGPVTVERA